MVNRRTSNHPSDRTDRDVDCSQWHPFVMDYGFYDPIKAGSIDGTDKVPHDRAISRALSRRHRFKNVGEHDLKV